MTRQEKVEEEIRHWSALFIERESNRDALITVTRVGIDHNFQHGTVFITILPDEKAPGVLDFLRRKRGELRSYVGEHVRVHTIPQLQIELDLGEKNRQHIDELLIEG